MIDFVWMTITMDMMFALKLSHTIEQMSLTIEQICLGSSSNNSFFFFNLLFILNRHWHTPVFVVHPALHQDVLRRILRI